MSNLTRYHVKFHSERYGGPVYMFFESPEGEYVKFDDIKELLNTAHNSRVTQCPTCGSDCTIGGDDKEGTHYYIPCRGAQS